MKAVASACTALLLLVAGCTRTPSSDAGGGRHSWTQPGTLRIAVVQEPKSLNPLLAVTTDDAFIDRLMFEPLITSDARGNPVPMLAQTVPTQENGGISRDGLTITYHLRPDARWTDGKPVTSQDVEFSWRAIMNSHNNVISRNGYDIVHDVETPDSKTAVVHLNERFSPFVNTFFADSDQPYEILPEHVLAKYPTINQLPFNEEPSVSDGPFRFGSWARGDRIVLQPNPAFFRGKPALDKILLQIVPDESTSVNLLRTHAIDYMFQASINTYPALKDLPDVKIVRVDMNGYEALEFNVSRPGISDPLVRRAIAYALDKGSIVARLTHDQAKVATEDIPDWMWAFDPTVTSYPYDLARAKQTLQTAGYAYGADGVARKGGQPLELLLSTDNANATHRAESVMVQEALRKIGLVVTVKYYPQNVLYGSMEMGGILQTGKFDLSLAPWYAGIDPDDSSTFTCAMRPPNGYNTSHYCNTQMEHAQRQALNNYDQAVRQVAYKSIERLLARDNPYIFFWWQRQQEAISVDFKGFAPNPVVESWNAWQWSI